MKCYIEGCLSEAWSRKMCRPHYMKWWHGGGIENEGRLKNENGEGTICPGGYFKIWVNGELVFEHKHIAEKALGKKLPREAIVHHVNGKAWDNRPENLVICPNQSYHAALHHRMKRLGIKCE